MIEGTSLNPCFRMDDLSSDTDINFLKKFCALFDRYNFGIMHGCTIFGPVGNTAGQNNLFAKGNDGIRKYCDCHISNNQEVINFINSREYDEIALHGYKHICYAYASYDEQFKDIELCMEECSKLFPKKEIKTLIPAFNASNNHTHKICDKLGLVINDASNSVLLETIEEDPQPHWLNKTLRGHIWKWQFKVPLSKLEKQLKLINDLLYEKHLTEKGEI